MDGLDIFSLFVILLLLAIAIWLVVVLGSMPGNIARQRNHPQADAITALSWIGIITMGASWLLAMVWAYYIPTKRDEDATALNQRVSALEQELEQIRTGSVNT